MKGSKVLITGATGFIGRHLCDRLAAAGASVHALVRPTSNHERIARVCTEIHVHDGTTEGMHQALASANPDVVFHLASHFVARHGSGDLETLVISNVLFPAQLLDAMRAASVKRIVSAGTVWQHYQGAPYSPVNLYAATKQASDDILVYYREAAGISSISLELSDTYGPGDTRRKLFKLLRDAARLGRPLEMSPGQQEIDLVYIDDVVDAFVLAGRRLLGVSTCAERYHVSSKQPRTVREVVERYIAITGDSLEIRWGALPYRDREPMQILSGTAAVPGWAPAVTLDEGIRRLCCADRASHG